MQVNIMIGGEAINNSCTLQFSNVWVQLRLCVWVLLSPSALVVVVPLRLGIII